MNKLVSILVTFFIFNLNVYSQKVDLEAGFIIEGLKASFKLDVKEELVSLKVLGFNENNVCHYRVRRLTAPQQTRGRSGNISSNKVEGCFYNTSNKKINSFFIRFY